VWKSQTPFFGVWFFIFDILPIMSPIAKWIIAIVLFLGLTVGYVKYAYFPSTEPQEQTEKVVEESPDGFSLHKSSFGVSFSYPDTYILFKENDPDAREAITLITKADARALEESEVPREGPTAITLQIFESALPASNWIKQNPRSNYNEDFVPYRTSSLAGEEAFVYGWSGLYEGESVLVAREGRLYLFSVTWMSADDPIRFDFRDLLATVRFDAN
jgi:hypothetical protein